MHRASFDRPGVLHIGKYFPPFAGGIEHFQFDLMHATTRLGWDNAAVVHNHRRGHRTREENIAGLPIYRVGTVASVLHAPISPAMPHFLRKAIREFRPEVLHVHLPNTSALALLALPAARRIPWVIHWHADVLSNSLDGRLAAAYRFYRPWEQRLLAKAAAVFVTSPPYLDASVALAKWRAKCHVVPLGVATERLPPPSAESLGWANQQWQADKFRVLCIGRLAFFKGHDVLLEALRQLPNAQLLIVGDGPMRNDIAGRISASMLNDRVKMLGNISLADDDRARALLATCDCTAVPSVERTESFGMVALEAMRYGKSVVASNLAGGGLSWLVRHEQSGLLVPPRDAVQLAAAIARLQCDATLRHRLGQRAAEDFFARFTIDTVAKQVCQGYQRVLQRAGNSLAIP